MSNLADLSSPNNGTVKKKGAYFTKLRNLPWAISALIILGPLATFLWVGLLVWLLWMLTKIF